MKKRTVQDERVILQHHKIRSEACSLMMFVLLASMLIQQFLFHAPFSQYAVEFICFFAASVYIQIRNIFLGNNILEEKSRKQKLILISSLTCSVTITLISGVLSYSEYKRENHHIGTVISTLLITFIIAFFTSFAIQHLLFYLNQKRQKRIEETLDDDENN